METFSASLAICAGNSPVPGEFPAQRPVTRSFDVFFDLRLNKRLSKQPWGWWFETPAWSLWRHRNDNAELCMIWSNKNPPYYKVHEKIPALQKFLINVHNIEYFSPFWFIKTENNRGLDDTESRMMRKNGYRWIIYDITIINSPRSCSACMQHTKDHWLFW